MPLSSLTNSYNEDVEWNKNFNLSFNHAMIEPESFTMIMFSCQPPSHVQDKLDKWDTVIWPHMLATAAKGWNVLYSEWPEISKQYIITDCLEQFSTTPRIFHVLDFAFQLISKSIRTAKLKSFILSHLQNCTLESVTHRVWGSNGTSDIYPPPAMYVSLQSISIMKTNRPWSETRWYQGESLTILNPPESSRETDTTLVICTTVQSVLYDMSC